MYEKLAGMTGTAATEAEEFWKIYKLEVLEIPTNVPMIRNDQTDLIYRDQNAKYEAVVNEIEERHKLGQPVLVGTTDISKSELIDEKLTRRGIPHEVLNAKQHEREASIIAEAGRPGAVTVATNMAGRGTDIVLGGNPEALDMSREQWEADHNKVVDLGGLHIVGTERHEARRIDNQLRGRSGRQGDDGSSRFYVALDDELMRRFGGDRLKTVMGWAGLDDNVAIENRMVSKSIEGAQVKVEAYHFDLRKHLVEYDDVINTHRGVIYAEREKVLQGADLKANIQSMVERELSDIFSRYVGDAASESWDVDGLVGELHAIFQLSEELSDPDRVVQMDPEKTENAILDYARAQYEEQEASLTPEIMRAVEREVMLRTIDGHWVSHLTGMENLRQGIGLHAFGQRDPLVMYKKEGRDMFQGLLGRIQYDIVRTVYHVNVTGSGPNGKAGGAGPGGPAGKKNVMTNVVGNRSPGAGPGGARKVGRNEPCPCESGKKYKRCHGA
jgi:preprotein translocase subunit SecA